MIITNNKSILFLVYILFSFGPLTGWAQSSVPFTFSLSSGARTSAGVFKKDGTLIRTLWSGVNYSAGSHSSSWDGTNDEGMLVPDSNYDIRVLSNNVNYTWEGVIGNSSAQFSGSTVMHSFQNMFSMAIAGSTIYYSTNYGERVNTTFKTSTTSPDSKTSLADQGGAINLVTTDGNYVYWAGYDPFSGNNVVAYIPSDVNNNTYVYATRVSDDQQVTFSSGSPLNLTYLTTPMTSCIDVGNASALISGIAVQKNGNYLFVAHKNLNRLDVLNKTTGALVRSITVTSPGSLAADGNGNLWMVSNTNTVSKYGVNADGSLTAASINLASLVSPLAIAVSPDNNTLIISDGGNSQQVKAFNTGTGSASWTYGQAGGYASDATVTNDKFYFTDIDRSDRSFVCFAPDGSFWVGDPGDNRSLHFASDRTYIEQMFITPHSYGCTVDPNDPTRAFNEYLEYKIDYTKSLDPKNGSWTLVKNWRYNISPAYDDMTRFFKVVTLTNGRTYGLIHHNNYKWAVVEFPANGNLRFTGEETPDLSYSLNPDGSLASGLIISNGSLTPYINMPLNGFDGANNPIWGNASVIVPAPPFSATDPQGDYATITSSNIVVAFDDHLTDGYHLAGIKPGSNKWLWRTAPSTTKNYTGPYLTDGSYDIGNGVVYGGSVVLPMDRSVIWGYHGEFWKNSQTNKWNQVYDDGLFVGQFGVTGPEVANIEAAASMAGNALSAAIVKDASGNYYLYHCDEFNHSGLHRWKITGLNTIQEQTIPVVLADSSHGLLGEYMDGSDLNNLNTKSTRIDKTVNFSWGSAVPVGTQISSASNFSVRWSGYVTPIYNESYVFTVNTSNKVRLWVNDSLLLDQWSNSSQNSLKSTSINLKAGILYTIVLEYGNSSPAGGGTESLSWSSPSQPLQIIPSGNLLPSPLPDTANGLDLMRGLHFQQTLLNNFYGWGRNPTQEDVNNAKYTKWWSVQSGFQSNYNPTGSPDVSASFTQSSNIYTVTRDLGTYSSNLNSWKLSGTINFLASNFNFGTGGMYLEVLDVSGKVITRFQVTEAFGANPSVSVEANSANIVSGTPDVLNPVVFQNQSIAITYSNGKAVFQYANYAPVSVPIFDATGNGLMPKTMRLYFFQNGTPYYNREIDLVSMRFSPNGIIAAPPPNQPPVAVTGPATTITLPANATLDGSKSYDPDGSIVSYGWVLLTGSGGTIVTPTGSSTMVTGLTTGTYIYKLTVTDDSNATAYALDTVYVKAAANLPPIANAGADQSITLPVNTVTVNGSASKDQDSGGVISSWSWSQSSGPSGATITSSTTAITTITGLQAGVYVFKLQVTDSNGATAYDSLVVTVKPAANLPPVANAGTSKSIILPVNTVNLDGSLSSDSDGTIVSYSWAQISGPSTSTLTNPGSVVTAANNLVTGQYIFELTVTDNSGAVSKAQVKITVVPSGSQPPVANAGANQTITLPVNQVNMDGSASVAPSGNIVSYTWTQISGPSTATLTAATSAQTNATGLIAGTYQFQLAIVDNNNVTAKDSVTIIVNPATNIPPVANAGASVIITLPANSTTLDGSKSSDADGTITSYSWTEISGPNTPGSTGVNSPSLSLTGLVAGQYIYQLTVTDNNGATGSAQVKVTVVAPANNIAPVANAGSDQRITAPVSSVNLNGSASYDPDGTITAYSWVLISGQGSIIISNANTATPSVMGLVPGAYVFQLTVTDNSGATNAAQVAVTVLPAATQPNQNPVANAGGDQTITAPASSVNLNGSASHDPDGTIAAYSWVLISGQGSVTISNANTATPSVTGLVPGVYVFQLTVTDNNGATNADQVTVTVNPASTQPNQNPVANAGNNLTITAPVNSVTLNGSSSFDPDGTIQSYLWSEVSGPSNATISNTGSVSPTVSGLVVGVYVFQLQVTDNDGATNTDQVTVNVQADVNKLNLPPVAIAGPDTTIYLPANSYTLNGQQSYDPDGTIVSYQWQQINGPNMEASTSMNGVQVNLTNMQAGAYQFQLTVTDNQGSTSTAVVKVSVDDASALADQIILFPNPAHDVITGKITSAASGTVKVTVFDMNGKTVMNDESVKSLDVYEKTFNISMLASGTYIVQVNIGYQKVMVAKFIKM
jgi:chitodextrinase